MNRISRRSAAETAEALLEAGRTQPALKYDVELGIARHQEWLRSEAPMPEWAGASVGAAASSMSIIAKTLLSAVVVGTLAAGAWYARSGSQPSAAQPDEASPRAESAQAVAPSAHHAAGSEPEAWLATTPMPISDLSAQTDSPPHRVGADKHKARGQRAHKEAASARAAGAKLGAAVSSADADSTRGLGEAARREPDALATNQASAARATRNEAASTATREKEPLSAATAEKEPLSAAAAEKPPISEKQRAQPEPAAQAQGPDDLAEMKQVATAEQLLERSPDRALALVRQADTQFPRGYFQQERAYIAIMALIRLGRIDEARARAASFAKRYPALPYGARIRSALDAHKAAASSNAVRGAGP